MAIERLRFDDQPERLPPHNVEAEEAVLGSVLLDREVIGRVSGVLDARDFYRERNGLIYQSMLDLYDRHEPVDYLTLIDELDRTQRLDQTGGATYVASLLGVVPTPIHAEHYAKIVADTAFMRRLISAGGKIATIGFQNQFEPETALEKSEQILFEIASKKANRDFAPLSEILRDYLEQLSLLREGEGIKYGVPSGYADLDKLTAGGFQRSDLVILAARPSMGKAQPLDAQVLTEDGWKAMGDLQFGDRLASVDGQPSRVTGIFPQGLKQTYRVTFSDGRSTECCDEHLWKVMYRDWPAPKVVTTARLREMLTRVRYKGRLWIETPSGDFGHQADLPLDPWVLGALLGDGTMSRLCISTADLEILERFRERLGPELMLVSTGGVDYRIRRVGSRWQKGVSGVVPNPVREALIALGLSGKRSHEKFIPTMYMSASREARLDLLRGLIDTDGWVEEHGSVCFVTTSEQLAQDVATLTRSLGGICRVRPPRRKHAVQGDVRKEGRPAYVLTLSMDDPQSAMTLQRKRIKALCGNRHRRLTFASIEPSRVAETQCIAVTHPDQTYITDDYIVTHNTSLALGIAANAGLKFKAASAIFSLEMSGAQLAARLLSTESGIETTRLRSGNLTDAESRKLGHALGILAETQIYIDDTPGLSVTNLRAKTRRLHAEVPLDLVIVDHLQLMTAGEGSGMNRVQEMSEISRQLKGLARELHVPVIALSQLSRAVEQRSPKIPILSDLRESGSIEQDADLVMFIYRDDYYNKDSEKQGIADIHIAKHRNGPTGQISLLFNQRTTKFLDLEVYRD
ncbi:MAG TPA: replicative DNA helicase [Chloroflexota bacterium]|nr:replicative DNA helicase [Chloroflexota bacterium]